MLERVLAHVRGNGVAYAALFVALSGTAVAAASALPPDSVGTAQLKNKAVTGAKVAQDTLTGANIAESTLGVVPNAAHLGGRAPSVFQARVASSCASNAGIQAIAANGTVTCGHVSFYSGRVVTQTSQSPVIDTFLTIPGVAHVTSLTCTQSVENAELANDAPGTTDLWSGNDSTYVGNNWDFSDTAGAQTSGAVWHLGQGTGAGAKVITITVSMEDTGTDCIFQGTAEVTTS